MVSLRIFRVENYEASGVTRVMFFINVPDGTSNKDIIAKCRSILNTCHEHFDIDPVDDVPLGICAYNWENC